MQRCFSCTVGFTLWKRDAFFSLSTHALSPSHFSITRMNRASAPTESREIASRYGGCKYTFSLGIVRLARFECMNVMFASFKLKLQLHPHTHSLSERMQAAILQKPRRPCASDWVYCASLTDSFITGRFPGRNKAHAQCRLDHRSCTKFRHFTMAPGLFDNAAIRDEIPIQLPHINFVLWKLFS